MKAFILFATASVLGASTLFLDGSQMLICATWSVVLFIFALAEVR